MKIVVPITEALTWIPIAFAACCDLAVFVVDKFDPRDGAPIYGIEAEVYDEDGTSLYQSRVFESYDPPVAETTTVRLPPGSSLVRCEIFGPNLRGKWSDARFEIYIEEPKLSIEIKGTTVVLSWETCSACWILERLVDGFWIPSPSVVPIDDQAAALFRLRRSSN